MASLFDVLVRRAARRWVRLAEPSRPTSARVVTLALGVVAIAATSAAAQDPTPGGDLPTDAQTSVPTKPTGLVFIPIVRSSPQIGFGVGGVAAYVFQVDSQSRRSGLGAGGLITDNDSWLLNIGGRVHFDQGNWRVLGGVSVWDFHYDFFGVGLDAGNANQSIPIKQRGNSEVLEVVRRIRGNFYLGPRYQYTNNLGTKLDGSNITGPLAVQALSQPNEYSVSALGAAAEYDTRNEQIDPTRGVWARGSAMYAQGWLGSDMSYNYYEAFWNQYIPVKWRRNDVLATRAYICEVGDAAPIWQMCQYALRSDLRGYPAGQYRDRAMFATQAEWRTPITERLSGALFVGVGGIADKLSSIATSNWLPSGGPGLRYLLFESWRIKVGVDYAFAKNGGEFYLRIGQAF